MVEVRDGSFRGLVAEESVPDNRLEDIETITGSVGEDRDGGDKVALHFAGGKRSVAARGGVRANSRQVLEHPKQTRRVVFHSLN